MQHTSNHDTESASGVNKLNMITMMEDIIYMHTLQTTNLTIPYHFHFVELSVQELLQYPDCPHIVL